MILPLYALNLGSGSLSPTSTPGAAYGPFLLYGLNLGSAAPALAGDFLNAVKLHYNASAALASGGTIYLQSASRRMPQPYIAFQVMSAPLSLRTSTSSLRRTRVRFCCYGANADVTGPIGNAVEAAFEGQTLVFQGGYTGVFVIGDRGQKKDQGLSNPGSEVWYECVEFSVLVNRAN